MKKELANYLNDNKGSSFKNKVQQVNKEIAIESLKSMLDWSDRIGSDERDEIDFVIDILKRN